MWGTADDDGPTVREEAPTFRDRPQPQPPIVKTRRRAPSSPPLAQGKTLHGYPFKPFADPPALTMKISQSHHASSTLVVISSFLGLVTLSALIAAIIAFAS